MRSIILHGHYYQPPRENPWLDLVDRQPSAAPFHDWNHRIERECYRAVVAARIPGPDGRIGRIVNTLASTSFDVGPTLLEWLEHQAPGTYAAILHADRLSQQRFGGHGSAMALPFYHPILPLASPRDRLTAIRWGITDFRRRFRREPEGMWLPETAVDLATLDDLAKEGIRFTVLAPHQVKKSPARGLPGLVRTSADRSIAVFIYDGPISHDVAFGSLLTDARAWADRLAAGAVVDDTPSLVSVATDGETFGHHHRFGDMALARVIDELDRRPEVLLDNFASFLARHPPEEEVELVELTSWSCAHGVERWRADCGCRVGSGGSQAWRAPLREALTLLAERCHDTFEREGAELFADPWAARDAYGEVVADPSAIAGLVRLHASRARTADDLVRAAELLELERNAQRLFTSCAWFFDDVGGLEAVQVLRYAARAIELIGPDSAAIVESEFLGVLAEARSNAPSKGTARDIYLREAKAYLPGAARAAAGWALLGAVGVADPPARVGCWISAPDPDGTVVITHVRTGRQERFRFRGAWLGGLQVLADVTPFGRPGDTLRFGLDHLFEPHRDLVVAQIRAKLVERTLTAQERRLLSTGAVTLRDLLRDALVEAVQALGLRPSEERLQRAEALLDLLELHQLPLPFDAQTDLYRLLSYADPHTVRQMAPLARRLGLEVPA
ncbi:MAG: DUF3536 domain-containing protein [Gemmatimonadota bacterium]